MNIAMKPMASLSHGSARAPRSGEPSAPQLANVTSAHEVFDMFGFLVIVFCKLCIRESFSVTECAVVYARFSLPKSILVGITPPDGRRGCPAFRAARPTHVSFEAEMSQNVIAAQKVRGRASPLGSVEPPRGPPNPKRDIRGDARLGIVQTRNALPSDAARARLPPRPRADLSPALKHTGHPGCEGIRPLPGLVAGTSPAPALHGRLGNENPSCSERAHGSSDADAPLVAAPAKTFLRAFRQTHKRSA